jgi:hypothetical protein
MILGNEVLASNYIEGLLDKASIWNKSLTATEVTTVYTGNTQIDLKKTAMSANLVGWWRMGDGDTYPIIKDHSYNRNNGTMTNMNNTSIIDLNKPESFIYYGDKANHGSNIEHITKVNLVGIWQDGDTIFALGRNGTFLNNLTDMSEGVWSYSGGTLSIEYALLTKSYQGFDGKVFKTGPQGGILQEIGKAPNLPSDFVLLGNWEGPKEVLNILGSGSFSSSIPNFDKGFYRVLDGYIQLVSGSRLILAYKVDGTLINPLNGNSFKQK